MIDTKLDYAVDGDASASQGVGHPAIHTATDNVTKSSEENEANPFSVG